ncbi:MAG: hypothetical protein WED82_02155 [Balneolales bacterium]
MKHQTGERFKKIADEMFDGNVSEMARMMGMTPQSFNKYAQGETLPGGVILKRVISLGINLNWLLAGIPPMMISDMKGSGVQELKESERIEAQDEGMDYFSHINESQLSETERDLLAEARQFSNSLKKFPLPLQVKRLMLELMIEHISQEIERLRNTDP